MIGVLYESGEWSDYKLAAELAEAGLDVKMVNLALGEAQDEHAGAVVIGEALACDMLVSRIFASAVFRGHRYVHERMRKLVDAAQRRGIPLINPGQAHFFEVDKRLATERMAQAGRPRTNGSTLASSSRTAAGAPPARALRARSRRRRRS